MNKLDENHTNPFRLDGKTALVTGGGSGLGFGIAECFVASGARVMIAGQTEGKLIEAVEKLGPNASYHVADVTDGDAAVDLVAACTDRFGKLDCLINNAGTHVKKPYLDMSVTDVQNVLDVHVLAAFRLSQLVIPAMRSARSGNIVFIASMASYLSIPQVIGYTAAKSAVLGLVRGTAAEIGSDNIRVNAIAPGWIASPMTEKALAGDPERKQKIISRTPMGRMGKPQDIGWAATYLCSDAAAFVTGHTLVVDGGAVSGF